MDKNNNGYNASKQDIIDLLKALDGKFGNVYDTIANSIDKSTQDLQRDIKQEIYPDTWQSLFDIIPVIRKPP